MYVNALKKKASPNWIILFKHIYKTDRVSLTEIVCLHGDSWKLLLNLRVIELVLHILKYRHLLE